MSCISNRSLCSSLVLFSEKRTVKGKVVSPSAPRTDADVYWGYQVRLASSIASVFTECPHKDGYDLTLGTSERGSCVDDLALDHFRCVTPLNLYMVLPYSQIVPL